MKKLLLIFISISYLQFNSNGQGCTFNVIETSFPVGPDTAFIFATKIWAYKLNSAIPIKINATYFTYPGGPLAITFSNGRKDFAGAPFDSTWYPTSLANSIAGVELNVGEYDMDIYVNGAFSWYFGTDGITPSGKYDFVSVIAHEIGHALGFTSLAKKDTTTGSIGFIQMSDFAPVVTSFPWPDQDSLPGIYDQFIETSSGTPMLTYANPSAALGSLLTNGALYFNGPFTLAANAGVRARLYAPATFTLGTSILHLNEATYPVGNSEELMTPFVSTGSSLHNVGNMTLGMLKDMGWSLYVGLDEKNDQDGGWSVYPNPVSSRLNLTLLPSGTKTIKIIDISGQTVLAQNVSNFQTSIDISTISEGIYTVNLINGNFLSTRKIIIRK